MQQKKIYLLFSLSLIFLLSSCAPRINIVVDEALAIDLEFASALEASIEPQIRSLMGLDAKSALFQKEAIEASLTKSGFSIDTIRLPSPIAVEIESKKQILKNNANPLAEFLSIEKHENKVCFTICISPEIMQNLIQSMPSEIQEYADLLMAPALTDEEMEAEEYLNLFSLVYGQSLSKAFENSFVKIAIRAPKKITSASVSHTDLASIHVDADTAHLSLSLYTLLALHKNSKPIANKQLIIELNWDS